MTLHFIGSDRATLGVELELQLIDLKTMDLTPRAQEVLTLCERRGIAHVKAEVHQSMLEIDTEVSKDVKQCRHSLEQTLTALHGVVDELGIGIAACGTHPFQNWSERLIFPNQRYVVLQNKFRWLIKRMNVYGLHMHIGVSDGEKAMALSRAMCRFLPHLLALSANSPFWHGQDTGMQTARPNILESFPTGGLPAYVENWKEFERYYFVLHAAGAIKSVKDLYWYIRPNLEYGTIEFRISDAMNSIDDIMASVAFIQNLVELVDTDPIRWKWTKEQHWVQREMLHIAARDGFSGVIVPNSDGVKKQIAEEIYALVDELVPIAKSLNNLEELLHIKNILKHGNGAMFQRKLYQESKSLPHIVEMCRQKFQLSMAF